MNTYRKAVLITLTCLNVLLLVGLLHTNMVQPAHAQSYRTTDYVVTTATIASDDEGLFIINLAAKKLAVWKWDRQNNRLVPIGARDLKNDFTNAGR